MNKEKVEKIKNQKGGFVQYFWTYDIFKVFLLSLFYIFSTLNCYKYIPIMLSHISSEEKYIQSLIEGSYIFTPIFIILICSLFFSKLISSNRLLIINFILIVLYIFVSKQGDYISIELFINYVRSIIIQTFISLFIFFDFFKYLLHNTVYLDTYKFRKYIKDFVITNIIFIILVIYFGTKNLEESLLLPTLLIILSKYLVIIIIVIRKTLVKKRFKSKQKDIYMFVTQVSNFSYILPFYGKYDEFVPIELDYESKVEILFFDFDQSKLKFHEYKKGSTIIIPYIENKFYNIYCIETINKKQKFIKIRVLIEKTESGYFVKSLSKEGYLFSSFKMLLSLGLLNFKWFKSAVKKQLININLKETIIQNAIYNERYGMNKNRVISLDNAEYNSIYINLPYGYGKTTYIRTINEKYNFNPVFITPKEVKNININYNIFKECYINAFTPSVLLYFFKSIYYYAYVISFILISIPILNFLQDVFEFTLNGWHTIIYFFIVITLCLVLFPFIINFKGHRDSGMNKLYIETIGKVLSKNKITIVIENFDRSDFMNFENLFILLEGLQQTAVNDLDAISFVINANIDSIGSKNKKSFIYQIEKHCPVSEYNQVDPFQYFRRIYENFEHNFWKNENVLNFINDDKFNHLYFDFRDATKLKGIIKPLYQVKQIRYKRRVNLAILSICYIPFMINSFISKDFYVLGMSMITLLISFFLDYRLKLEIKFKLIMALMLICIFITFFEPLHQLSFIYNFRFILFTAINSFIFYMIVSFSTMIYNINDDNYDRDKINKKIIAFCEEKKERIRILKSYKNNN